MANKPSMNDETAKVYETIGRILVNWQRVEDSLFELFSNLLESKNEYAAAIPFFCISSVNQKIKITDQLLKAKLSLKRSSEESWKLLKGKILEVSKDRNAVAHCTVIQIPEKRPGRRICVRASFYDFSHSGRPELFLRELQRSLGRIQKVAAAADKFCHEMSKQITWKRPVSWG
jgi:hypothetical protein